MTSSSQSFGGVSRGLRRARPPRTGGRFPGGDPVFGGVLSGPVLSGPVRSGLVRSGPVRREDRRTPSRLQDPGTDAGRKRCHGPASVLESCACSGERSGPVRSGPVRREDRRTASRLQDAGTDAGQKRCHGPASVLESCTCSRRTVRSCLVWSGPVRREDRRTPSRLQDPGTDAGRKRCHGPASVLESCRRWKRGPLAGVCGRCPTGNPTPTETRPRPNLGGRQRRCGEIAVPKVSAVRRTTCSGASAQMSALKISTSMSRSYPVSITARVSEPKSITPSPV